MKIFSLVTMSALGVGAVAAADTTPEALVRGNTTTEAMTTLLAGQVYQIVGGDIIGKDITNLQMSSPLECFTYCYSSPQMQAAGCSGSTWTPYQGGWCWTKRTDSRITPTAVNGEAVSYLVFTDVSGPVAWSTGNDGVDMPGNDLTNMRGYSIGDCMNLCSSNRDCYGVTWNGYNGGWCWLKYRANNFVPAAGTVSAYVARRISS